MSHIKLSIIVPMYNVEHYIERCVLSCLAQNMDSSDYEIIVVNDGSEDGSLAVVERMMQFNDNIVLINQKYKGVSAARNIGIKAAKGENIWFVDSDDRIEEGIAPHLLEITAKNRLDVLCFDFSFEFEDNGEIRKSPSKGESGTVMYGPQFTSKVTMPPAPWPALYRREYLLENELCFKEGIIHEDMEFTPRAYWLAKRIMYVNVNAYYYCQRKGSIMKSERSRQRSTDLLTVADSLYEFMVAHISRDDESYHTFCQKLFFCYTQSLAYYSPDWFSSGIYKSKPYYPFKLSTLSKVNILKGILVNISPRLYSKVNKLVLRIRRKH